MKPERYGAIEDAGSEGMNSPKSDTIFSILESFPFWGTGVAEYASFPSKVLLAVVAVSFTVAEAAVETVGDSSGSPMSTTNFHLGDGMS